MVCYIQVKIFGQLEVLNQIKRLKTFNDICGNLQRFVPDVELDYYDSDDNGVVCIKADLNLDDIPRLVFAHLIIRFSTAIIKLWYMDDNEDNMGQITYEGNNVTLFNVSDYLFKRDEAYNDVIERFPQYEWLSIQFCHIVASYFEPDDTDDDDDDIIVEERYGLLPEWMEEWSNYRRLPQKIPVLKIHRVSQLPEDWDCGVCQDKTTDENPVVKMRCGGEHIFHKKCVKKWSRICIEQGRKADCPLCRRIVVSTSSQEPESQQTPIAE
jgi:hypothetical protein